MRVSLVVKLFCGMHLYNYIVIMACIHTYTCIHILQHINNITLSKSVFAGAHAMYMQICGVFAPTNAYNSISEQAAISMQLAERLKRNQWKPIIYRTQGFVVWSMGTTVG